MINVSSQQPLIQEAIPMPLENPPKKAGANSLIEVVQEFLSETYEFRFNAITQRLLVRIRGTDEPFHYLNDYDFN